MANFIITYKTISDNIGAIYAPRTNIINDLNSMADHLWRSNVSINNIDKKWLYNIITSNASSSFYDNYFLINKELSNFVLSLQRYVTNTYGSVNIFLKDNDIKVLSSFAAISEVLGYPIDTENIYVCSVS